VKSELDLTVRYVETDKSGRVYHANYFIYLDLARTDFLKKANLEYKDIEDKGLFFVAVEVQGKYLQPLNFADKFKVVTILTKIKKASLTFSYEIRRDNDLLFTGETKLALVSSQGRPLRIPDEIVNQVS